MMEILIFGEVLPLPYDGAVGGLANRLKLNLSANGKGLKIVFQGEHPFGTAKFSANLRCSANGTRVELEPIDNAGTGDSLHIDFPLKLGSATLAPVKLLVTSDRQLAFFDDAGLLEGALRQIPIANDFDAMRWGQWTHQFAVQLDLKARQLCYVPTVSRQGAEVILLDDFRSLIGAPLVNRKQPFWIERVTATTNLMELVARAQEHIAFIHPDVLSAASLGRAPNPYLYQHALVNGALTFRFRKDLAAERAYSWEGNKGQGKPGMLVFRLTDEHGHPLLIEPGDGVDGFDLAQRVGVNSEHSSAGGDRWEMTNSAITVFSSSPLDVVMRSLDPKVVDSYTQHYEKRWLDSTGLVKTAGGPREIHGLAKGTFLRRIDSSSSMGLKAELVTQPIKHKNDTVFFQSAVEMPINVTSWSLMTQLEERDVVPGELLKEAPIGHRVSNAKSGGLRLPLIDTSYALANLADPKGRVEANTILVAAGSWLRGLDEQFAGPEPRLFEVPSTEMETHVAKFVMAPSNRTGLYAGILDLPPGAAKTVAETARTGAEMGNQKLDYVHGGKRKLGEVGSLKGMMAKSVGDFGTPMKEFERFWNPLDWNPLNPSDATKLAARAALREYMGLARRSDFHKDEYDDWLKMAKEILHGGRYISELEPSAVEELRKVITPATTRAQFINCWTTPPDARTAALLDLMWAGTGPSVYRRASDLARNGLPDKLKPHEATLKEVLIPYTLPDTDLLPGFVTPGYLGEDPGVAVLAELWAKLAVLEKYRAKFGIELTPDVYRRLGETQYRAELLETLKAIFMSDEFRPLLFKDFSPDMNGDFSTLCRIIGDRWDFSSALKPLRDKHGSWQSDVFEQKLNSNERLQLFTAVIDDVVDFYSKLRVNPPEYLFFSSRVCMSVKGDAQKLGARLWNQKFRLTNLGNNAGWAFLLDSESAVIMKLSGTRSLDAILEEVEASYRTPQQPNPLGFPKDLKDFIQQLDPEIRKPRWQGVLIIRPTADIGGDEQLVALAGFKDITMVYAAIGGGVPENPDDSIDVYARIFHERQPFTVTGTPPEDLSLSLIKFDASIRNTQLVAGEVLFRLDLRNVFGRDTTANQTKYPPLYLQGTLPRDKQGGGNSFEFSARFTSPISFDVDIAFIKAFVFRSLRVSTNRGQTSVDIDADVLLKSWNVKLPGTSFNIGPDSTASGDFKLDLQNFRILLPKFSAGVSIPFGLSRLLNFELPAISFTWPKPRPINLWDGIELAPIGMGFIRRVADAATALKDFVDRYEWLSDEPTGAFQIPYLRCSIHFGKLPSLGGTGLSRLDLEVVIALVIKTAGGAPEFAFGIGGIDARDISFDLFGVIKLELEKLILGRFKTSNGKEAITLLVKNPRLTILGWSPIPDNAQFKFVLAHGERNDNRAALGVYTKEPADADDSCFKLHWLLLAHNLKLENDFITQYLMTDALPGNAHKLLDNFIDVDKKTIAGQILDDNSWLLGASFSLAEKIVEHGTLVLHDQHYYGIALRGPAIEALFDVKRLELCYMPGPTRAQDRFRACFRLAALDFIGQMRSGDIAIEWGFNWDFLLDFGFPWKSGAAYRWERAFSLPMGSYEAKFGLYCEKRTGVVTKGAKELTLSAGVGFYLGYYIGFGTPGRFVWAQAGIGIFAILEGSIRFEVPAGGSDFLKGTVKEVMVRGVIGIYAYGEGGIEIWVISARFRVSVQAAIAGEFHYLPGGNSTLRYAATLYAGYSASCRIGSGWFSYTFNVSGSIEFEVSGQALLN